MSIILLNILQVNFTIIYATVTLTIIGIFAAIILYFIARKFKIFEDPRIDEVTALLPGANCGGCGFAGCRNLAENMVRKESVEGFFCPPGGSSTMNTVAAVFGQMAGEQEVLIAVVRCNGTLTNAELKNEYDGLKSCFFIHQLYSGMNGCPYGCLGCGDCVEVCRFDAMYIDQRSGLPVILQDKCIACGACVKACPRRIIELRKKDEHNHRIFVCCVNKEPGGAARKNCNTACTGCRKCVNECRYDAITVENHLAYIDGQKCTLCGKCVATCPTHAIWEVKDLQQEFIEGKLAADDLVTN